MKDIKYSKEFYQKLINNLADLVTPQELVQAVVLTTLQVPNGRQVLDQDIKSKVRFTEVDGLLQRLNEKKPKVDPKEVDLIPLKNVGGQKMPLFDLRDLALRARVNFQKAHTWLLTQGVTPIGYGENQDGELVAGYTKSVLDTLIGHSWEISEFKIKDGSEDRDE